MSETAQGTGVWERIRRGEPPSDEGLAEVAAGQRARLGREGAAELDQELRQEVLGLGPLERAVADERVTDVLLNGTEAWIDRGEGLERIDPVFADASAVRRFAVRLAALCGRRLDDASPWVDGILPTGIRFHGILPPLVDDGAHVSLRVPQRKRPRLRELAAWGMVDQDGAEVLRQIVHSRAAFVVTGGTGSGKTTLLGAMLAQVPHPERIVLVEDVRELSVEHPHVVRLQGRSSNVEGRGEVTLTDLVRQSLRMRPDRVVVGEVRGAEVRELLTALNTGHEGGCGTLHANGAVEVVSRFEALGALADMNRSAVHAQLSSAVDVVIHLDRRAGRREVSEIAVLSPGVAGGVDVTPALVRGPRALEPGAGWATLQALLATNDGASKPQDHGGSSTAGASGGGRP